MTFLSLVLAGNASVFAQSVTGCLGQWPNWAQTPFATTWAISPTVYQGALSIPGVAGAIVNGSNVWSMTDAAGRLAGWNGIVTGSDCPTGQPFQVTAYPFATSGSCPLAAPGSYNLVAQAETVLAFADMWQCAGCGSKSVSINLSRPWSVDPNPFPHEYDLESVVAHEFGHVLGSLHLEAGTCNYLATPSLTCGASPNKPTMANNIYAGETCGRTLAPDDISNMNSLY